MSDQESSRAVQSFRVRFSVSAVEGCPDRKNPYTGSARVKDGKMTVTGTGRSTVFWRVMPVLSAVVAAGIVTVSNLGAKPEGSVLTNALHAGAIGGIVGGILGAAMGACAWLFAKLLGAHIAFALRDASMSITHSSHEYFVQILRPNGKYLFFMPAPEADADFLRLISMLKEWPIPPELPQTE